MEQGSATTGIVISAIVALAVGGTAGYAIGMNMEANGSTSNTDTSQQQAATATKAADLRVGLNNLLREHVSVSLDVTRDIVDDSPDLAASKAAQAANAGDIAAAVGSIYGEEAQAQITELFVDHIEQSNAYAAAVEAGDEAAQEAALVELREYLTDIAAFFSGAIEGLPQDTVYALLEEHETLLNDSVTAYAAGDFARSYELEREALTQVSSIGDALAKGIVNTKPDMF
ncbi:MAG TPA: hypothetical protein VFM68_03225 [Candidatus Saccharimonadales bacterium]|nr:hypothetical protein [Candidatus Saccharimonadales bacterium]